ncbi:MAG TPA: hypothetical protein VNF99_12235 [Stellaceae bacterium]|nr:hypothetical protein [Stellaceae bacterium]
MARDASKDALRRAPGRPAYDNPTGDKGELYDQETGHPRGGQHVQRPGKSGDGEKRPVGHASDRKLGQKPPSR